jgi:peptidoglycan/xylan/chitin deacetylase (PgdA/CDA1 family)
MLTQTNLAVSRVPCSPKAKWLRRICGLAPGFVIRRFAPVLTYHSCSRELPPNVSHVDNVAPEQLYYQLETLRKQFRFVNIDEFCNARSWRGLAAATFDDGYKNVVHDALPVFSALDIPLTVFVNNIGFEQRTFWRHKLAFILQNGLAHEFECSVKQTRRIPGLSLHEYSKHPDNSSISVEAEIDKFFVRRQIKVEHTPLLFDTDRYFVAHPLVWYGNHSASHYVLSSLSLETQYAEIKRTRDLLQQRAVNISSVFALPFGQTYHFNRDTLAALKALDYKFMLMNRNRLNGNRPSELEGIRIVERFSVLDDVIMPQLDRAFLSNVLHRFRRSL